MQKAKSSQPAHARGLAALGLVEGKFGRGGSPVMRAVGLRSDFFQNVFRGFRKVAVFQNQSKWCRDGKPRRASTTARAQSRRRDAVANRAGCPVCATQQWHAPDSASTGHRSVGRLLGAVLAGDACRWVLKTGR